MDFNDIRPYTDSEVVAVIDDLINDKHFLLMLLRMRLRATPGWLLMLLLPLVRLYLRYQTRNIDSISRVQDRVYFYVRWVLRKTTKEYQVTGLDASGIENARLFIANHRDIVLDPAMVNFALRENKLPTVQIAIGDNLLQVPFVSKLMRLNKGFLVKRGAQTRVQKYVNLQQLSHYIHQTVTAKKESVWIAQREGRAKDGIDKTDTSILKMLCLHTKKTHPPIVTLRQFRVTPVAISYEWDPCDCVKARELVERAATGQYIKKPLEDIESIKTGIIGYKGRTHVAFCPEIEIATDDPAQVAEVIDKSIALHFFFMPSHCAAYRLVCKQHDIATRFDLLSTRYTDSTLDAAEQILKTRAHGESEAVSEMLIRSYANPVFQYLLLHHDMALLPC